jgi:murein DD-endopeptidase MepM/ murein hydrolase activator NlpD
MRLKELTGTHELDEIADKDLIKEIQFNLNRLGYFLEIDGIVGDRTLAAFARFKKDRYLDKPAEIGESSIKLLLNSPTPQKGFHLPTNGVGWVSSPYGRRSMGFHKGIDIAANEGVKVYAVEEGIVSNCVSGCNVGNFRCGGGYGNVVYIAHDLKEFDESRYAHLSRLAAGISIGTRLKKGDLLGYVGNTGHSFGNHLHFEVRLKNKAFNPQLVINPIV